ncbi:MAG: hypothetical protein JSR82_12430 [Verrucomicrobia bacterium]|nr:hypothetical protein [Verrucomicrobiota bacterium]
MPDLDPLLSPFLDAPDEASARACLGRLVVEVAAPIIRRVVLARTGATPAARSGTGGLLEAEDIAAEAQAALVRRLLALRQEGGGSGVRNFRAYCAAAAQRSWIDQLRLVRPGRARLLHQVRYLLGESRRVSGFALWTAPDDPTVELGGFGAWQEDSHARAPEDRLRALAEDPAAFVSDAVPDVRTVPEFGPARLLAVILDRLGGPAPVDDLVEAVGRLWDEAEGVPRDPPPPLEELPTSAPGPDEAAGWLDCLRWLWAQIPQLSPPQRLAFVLHSPVTREWEYTGVATRTEIAAVLGLPLAELERLWPDIPLPDAVTAARLGVAAQNIINLRKAARLVLGRKLVASGIRGPIFPSTPVER